jgi:23S rRNA pseudouridine1911/1915/1917 synthase
MIHSESETVIINPADVGQRLDKCLALHLPGFSRNRMQQLIAEGCVTAEGNTITDAARKVKQGETYKIAVPEAVPLNLVASSASLCVVFEDADLLIIDKAAGMTVHPGPGHTEDTLVNALLAHCGASLSGIGGVMRPGIVHRIDKDTSGLLVVAKHDAAHKHLSAQLAARTLKRQYLAVVKGLPKLLVGKIDAPIGRSSVNRKKMAVVGSGKAAVTHYTTEAIFKDAALLRCTLETGRTHQIRVHLAHIGHPLIGDPVYGRRGKNFDFHRQALHATALALIHPSTGKIMEFSAPLPQDMQTLLAQLKKDVS